MTRPRTSATPCWAEIDPDASTTRLAMTPRKANRQRRMGPPMADTIRVRRAKVNGVHPDCAAAGSSHGRVLPCPADGQARGPAHPLRHDGLGPALASIY